MKHSDSWYLTFRFDPANREGEESVTFIVGGDHKGGIAEGRLSWTGGLPTALADCLTQRVDRWISEAIGVPNQLTFTDTVDAGDPPLW